MTIREELETLKDEIHTIISQPLQVVQLMYNVDTKEEIIQLILEDMQHLCNIIDRHEAGFYKPEPYYHYLER